MATKNTSNFVKSQSSTFRLTNMFLKNARRYGYFMLKNEVRWVLQQVNVNKLNPVSTVVYYHKDRTEFTAERTASGGLKIGCQEFDLKNTRKLATWVGFTTRTLKRYFPTAKAQAKARLAGSL